MVKTRNKFFDEMESEWSRQVPDESEGKSIRESFLMYFWTTHVRNELDWGLPFRTKNGIIQSRRGHGQNWEMGGRERR